MSLDLGTYASSSALVVGPDRTELGLATGRGLTPGGLVEHPSFFQGFAAHPAVFAAGILAVADLAGSTYNVGGPFRDPVVTAGGDRLRLESFSGENGVHARLDLLPDGIEAGDVGLGTTNVDINAPLRVALASVRRDELLHLDVGGQALRVATLGGTHVERKVDLPERWVRSLAEVGTVAKELEPVIRLDRHSATAFLANLPGGVPGPTQLFGAVGGRLRQMPASRARVMVAGTGRLATLTRLVRHLTALDVLTHPDGFSGWVVHLPGARLTLLLTPEPYRGFSGEGRLLGALADDRRDDHAQRLLEHLGWDPVVDPAALAQATGLTGGEVESGLAALAASGRLGYDLGEQQWFHRELPLDLASVQRRHPRLTKARALVEAGAVEPDPTAAGRRWIVTSGDRDHVVTAEPDGQRCTCEWWTRYVGGRGTCAHVLAVDLMSAPGRGSADIPVGG